MRATTNVIRCRSGGSASLSFTPHAILATATAAMASTSAPAGDGVYCDLNEQEGK